MTHLNTEALEFMMEEYHRDPEAFLKDEFRRTSLAKAIRDFASIAAAFSQTHHGAVTYGNMTACNRLYLDAENIEGGNAGFHTPGGSIASLSETVEDIRAKVDHEIIHNVTVTHPSPRRGERVLLQYTRGSVDARETAVARREREDREARNRFTRFACEKRAEETP